MSHEGFNEYQNGVNHLLWPMKLPYEWISLEELCLLFHSLSKLSEFSATVSWSTQTLTLICHPYLHEFKLQTMLKGPVLHTIRSVYTAVPKMFIHHLTDTGEHTSSKTQNRDIKPLSSPVSMTTTQVSNIWGWFRYQTLTHL